MDGEFRIGVSGHRDLSGYEMIPDVVDAVLDSINSIYKADSWMVVSPLAEGADRLVAARAISQLNARLVVPLPLPLDDYLLDFPASGSRDEFQDLLLKAEEVIQLPGSRRRDLAYAAAGQYVVNHSDLLIAIWDGKPAHGLGGTGEIVELARKTGLPLVWIAIRYGRPGGGEPGRGKGTLADVRFERIPGMREKFAS
jgi:hypothetical protein